VVLSCSNFLPSSVPIHWLHHVHDYSAVRWRVERGLMYYPCYVGKMLTNLFFFADMRYISDVDCVLTLRVLGFSIPLTDVRIYSNDHRFCAATSSAILRECHM
jgi:hypothetical protein